MPEIIKLLTFLDRYIIIYKEKAVYIEVYCKWQKPIFENFFDTV